MEDRAIIEDDGIILKEVDTGFGEDCEITLFYNQVRFIVVLKRSDPDSDEDSIEEALLRKLDILDTRPDDLDSIMHLEDIQELAISKSRKMIYKLAPQGRGNGDITLHEMLHPKTFVLQLKTIRGELKIEQLGGLKAANYNHGNAYIPLKALPFERNEVQFVSAKDIEAIDDLDCGNVSKVSWRGELYAFKSTSKGREKQLLREMKAFREISKIRRPGMNHPQIPRLHAIVESRRGAVGFLEDYIDTAGSLSEYSSGYCEYIGRGQDSTTKVTDEEKERWTGQIEEAIQFLHRHGIVWGDAKAENVLIDNDRDAWVVDFGGSWAQGWVDRELNETIEGDLQGLQKIKDCLNGAVDEESDCSTPRQTPAATATM